MAEVTAGALRDHMVRLPRPEPMSSDEVGRLYERFGCSVHRRCLRVMGNEAAAEDVVQDVFVRVLRYGGGFRGESILAWLHRIADRACLDRIACERPNARVDAGGELADPPQAPVVAEPSRLLRELLARLPRKLGEVAILSYVDELEQAEIARALGCSTMTVRRRLRALRKAARTLTGDCGEEVRHARLAI